MTSLFGGRRVSKAALRVEAYGTVDELNSALGVAASFAEEGEIFKILRRIQNDLFVVGAELATPKPPTGGKRIVSLDKDKVEELEAWIDEYDAKLPPLKTFILPSGSPLAVHLHAARSVCRRAERASVKIRVSDSTNRHLLPYLNRLSDLLFILARYSNKRDRCEELPWLKD